jgi:hypothetical protein
MINAPRGPQSSTNIQDINKKNEEAKEHRSQTYRQVVNRDRDLVTHQHAQAGSQQKKKKASQKLNQSATFHKGEVFTMSTSPLIDSRATYK